LNPPLFSVTSQMIVAFFFYVSASFLFGKLRLGRSDTSTKSFLHLEPLFLLFPPLEDRPNRTRLAPFFFCVTFFFSFTTRFYFFFRSAPPSFSLNLKGRASSFIGLRWPFIPFALSFRRGPFFPPPPWRTHHHRPSLSQLFLPQRTRPSFFLCESDTFHPPTNSPFSRQSFSLSLPSGSEVRAVSFFFLEIGGGFFSSIPLLLFSLLMKDEKRQPSFVLQTSFLPFTSTLPF